MAGYYFRHSLCQNSSGTGGDEPIRGTQRPPTTNDSNFSLPTPPFANSCIPTPTAFYTPTPALAFVPMPAPLPAPAPTPTPAPVLASGKYINADFYQFIKVFIDAQKRSGTHEGPWESLLKARFPDLYYRKFYMDCYQFFQQYEDHFKTASATGPNYISFVALFFRGPINFC